MAIERATSIHFWSFRIQTFIFSRSKVYFSLIMRATLLFVILLQTWISTVQLCPQHCSCKPVGAQAEWLRLKCGDSLQEINDVDINAVSVELIQLYNAVLYFAYVSLVYNNMV